MEESKMPLLQAAIADLKAYAATLVDDELIAGEIKDFDYVGYARMFEPPRNRPLKEGADTDAEKQCRRLIQDTKDQIASYWKQKDREIAGLTIPKLLARYIKLPDLWRLYVRKRLDPLRKDDEGKSNNNDSSDDEQNKNDAKEKRGDREKRGDKWIFATFAVLDEGNDGDDADEAYEEIDRFAKFIKIAEDAQPPEAKF